MIFFFVFAATQSFWSWQWMKLFFELLPAAMELGCQGSVMRIALNNSITFCGQLTQYINQHYMKPEATARILSAVWQKYIPHIVARSIISTIWWWPLACNWNKWSHQKRPIVFQGDCKLRSSLYLTFADEQKELFVILQWLLFKAKAQYFRHLLH